MVAEAAGVVALKKAEGDTVTVGDLLATIDTAAAKPASSNSDSTSTQVSETVNASAAVSAPTASPSAPSTSSKAPAPAVDSRPEPAVSRMAGESA